MKKALPGGKEASYRLLGLQALAHDSGVIVKRGTRRLFLEGRETAELLDLLVERTATGRAVAPERLRAELPAERRDALMALIETLKEHRFLVPGEKEASSRYREDTFFWNYDTTFADVVGELAEIRLTVLGVNSIGLTLLGNLRGCGFRDIAFVDHPALRNLDYYDSRHRLRPEISGALSVPPQPFDKWNAENPEPAGCLVVTCDFGGRPLMREWNRSCLANGLMFYPIVLLDHVAQIGPLVVPGEGPCYECLWTRQNANMADAALARAGEMEAPIGQRAIGYLQPMARVAADFAAIDLLKHFASDIPGGHIGRMVEVDLLAPSTVSRDLLKVPRCPVCSATVEVAVEAEAESETEAEAETEEKIEAKEADTPESDTESAEAESGPREAVKADPDAIPPHPTADAADLSPPGRGKKQESAETSQGEGDDVDATSTGKRASPAFADDDSDERTTSTSPRRGEVAPEGRVRGEMAAEIPAAEAKGEPEKLTDAPSDKPAGDKPESDPPDARAAAKPAPEKSKPEKTSEKPEAATAMDG